MMRSRATTDSLLRTFAEGITATAIVLGALLLSAPNASANLVLGEFLGVFSGNDKADTLTDLLLAQGDLAEGQFLVELAKVETPATSNDGLTVFDLAFKDGNEPISGTWSYAGPEIVDILVVKAGNMFAAYLYNDAISGNMPNMGLWDTSALDNKGMSHVTAYSVVPEPAAVLLVGFGLGGLAFVRGRRRSRAS